MIDISKLYPGIGNSGFEVGRRRATGTSGFQAPKRLMISMPTQRICIGESKKRSRKRPGKRMDGINGGIEIGDNWCVTIRLRR